MKIEYMTLGPFATNTYIVYDEKTLHGVVIDPSFSPDKYISELNDKKITLESILLTHAHVDHLAGLNQLREAFPDAKFYMDKRDEELLRDPHMNLSDFLAEPIVCKPADVWVKDKDIIRTCGLEFTVLDTAGHTPGGISFYLKNEGIVFTGDSLFRGSIGRTDFPGGNLKELLTNIRQNLFQLPDSVRVLSGHGEITTVGHEKESNPFFQEGF